MKAVHAVLSLSKASEQKPQIDFPLSQWVDELGGWGTGLCFCSSFSPGPPHPAIQACGALSSNMLNGPR